nr:unnamed protein product [Rangifer tarandus platyrhynchus]
MKAAPLSVAWVEVLAATLPNFSPPPPPRWPELDWLTALRAVCYELHPPWVGDLSHERPVVRELYVQTHWALGRTALSGAGAVSPGCAQVLAHYLPVAGGSARAEELARNLADSAEEGARLAQDPPLPLFLLSDLKSKIQISTGLPVWISVLP